MAFYLIPFFSPFAKSIFSPHSGDGIHFLQQAAQAQWMLHKFLGNSHQNVSLQPIAALYRPLHWEICKTKVRLVLQGAIHIVIPNQDDNICY